MKVYRVVTDRDGITSSEPGKRSTEIVREELKYAAETIQEVWDAIEWIRFDEERTLIAIIEEFPTITIITPKEE